MNIHELTVYCKNMYNITVILNLDMFEKRPLSLKKIYSLINFSVLCICQRIILHNSQCDSNSIMCT